MPFNWDEPLSPPRDLPTTYPLAEFEPFTQHAYYKLPPDGPARQITPAQLANCSSHHVRCASSCTTTRPRTSGAAVGCDGLECERFTASVLSSIYVIQPRARSTTPRTLPVIAVLVPILMAIVCWVCEGWLVVYVPVGPRTRVTRQGAARCAVPTKAVWWVRSPVMLYALATWAIIVDLFETFVHFAIAGDSARQRRRLLHLLVLHGTGCSSAWRCRGVGARDSREPVARLRVETKRQGTTGSALLALWAHAWSLAEIPPGSRPFHRRGLYARPVCITLAGLVRLVNWARGRPAQARVQEHSLHRAREDDTDCGYASSGGGGGGDPSGLYLS